MCVGLITQFGLQKYKIICTHASLRPFFCIVEWWWGVMDRLCIGVRVICQWLNIANICLAYFLPLISNQTLITMKRILLLCLFMAFLAPLVARAQLRGVVLSNASGVPIRSATVRLFAHEDSTFVRAFQTSRDGVFIFNGVRPGTYILSIASSGYEELSKDVTVYDETFQLETIYLNQSNLYMPSKQSEIAVKRDTIEYHAAAYFLPKTATLEDLLVQINGVQVDQKGNITIQGEAIRGLQVENRSFFGEDVVVVMRHLPAAMIDKIQLFDDKSIIGQRTGFSDNHTERILNVCLQKSDSKPLVGSYSGTLGMDMVSNDGRWFYYGDPSFGKTEAEHAEHFFQNDFRYQVKMFTNIRTKDGLTTVITGANNINDIPSSVGQTPLDDNNAGVTWVENVGVNTNLTLDDRIRKIDSQTSLRLDGDVTFNHKNSRSSSQSYQDAYTEQYTYSHNDSSREESQSWNTRLRMQIDYQIDTLNELVFTPTIAYTNRTFYLNNDYTIHRITPTDTLSQGVRINQGNQTQQGVAEELQAGLQALYHHRFLREGRSLSMQAHVNYSNAIHTTQTNAYDAMRESSFANHQLSTHEDVIGYALHASYVEPLYRNHHFLQIAVSLSGNSSSSLKEQHNNGIDSRHFARYDSAFSSRLQSMFYAEQVELNYRWVSEAFDLLLGARVLAQQARVQTVGPYTYDTLYTKWTWAPNVDFKYRIHQHAHLRMFYQGHTLYPAAAQLQPVSDAFDALNEYIGHVGVQPAFEHKMVMSYASYNPERFSAFTTGIRASVTEDALVNNIVYDALGRRYNQVVNADVLPWNVGWNMQSTFPFHNNMFFFHSGMSVDYVERVAYVSHESANIGTLLASIPLPMGKATHTGNLFARSELSLRFTHPIVDLVVRNANIYSLSRNRLNDQSKSSIGDWVVSGDIAFHLPRHWDIGTDVCFVGRFGYLGIADPNELVWNVFIQKSWGNATLKLKVYDLLHSEKNIVQVVDDISITYRQFETLPTYALLTYTYQL